MAGYPAIPVVVNSFGLPSTPTSLKIGKEIRRTNCGVVCAGELNGESVAVRKIDPALRQRRDVTMLIVEEALLMKQLSHPHVVKFFEVYYSKEDGPVYVMERMCHNLRKHLALNRGKLSRERQIDICLQISDAVHYLHSQQPMVVRRNLSDLYIWFSQDGTVKLGGCTHVARLPPSGFFVTDPLLHLSPYMPPEALLPYSRYNEKVDIFLLGVVMLQVATQQFPTVSRSELTGSCTSSEIDRRTEDLSLVPEDHPLKPIILQCLRDDPEERPNSGTVLRLLSEVSSMIQATYQEALQKHGSVVVDVTQCIFVGAPAVGKSSLKHLLVHNTPKAVKTSTAVVDAPEVVTISSEQYAVEGGISAWQLVSKDVMGKSLQACIKAKAYDEGQYPELLQHEGSQHQQMEATHPHTPLSFIQKLGKLIRRVFRASDTHYTVSRQSDGVESSQRAPRANSAVKEGYNNDGNEIVALLDMEHSCFMQEMRLGCRSVKLKDASFIHLLDTGGQPSFQDALPLLLDAPCTYIQVFNAARDLDQPIPITYRSDDHTEVSLPPSAETEWQMMLRSFSSMQTMAHKCSKEMGIFQQEEGQLPPLRIFVVGTFKDQLVEEGRHKEAAQDISKRLKELEGKPYYCCIQKDSTGQPFYLINNMGGKEVERAYVNSLRKHLSAARSCFKLRVPVMWYICEQITQGLPQKFIRFQDLKIFCLKQKFIDTNGADEQFYSLLKLLSFLGFYSFFDLKDVPDEANYVCTSKGVFLKEVSKLLAVQFLQAPRCYAVEVFKQDGIISNNVEIFEELGIIAEVDRKWFLAALEHVGLLARYASAADCSPSYFMPIALPLGKTKLPDCGSVASLCVTFTFHSLDSPLVYTDLPRGIFCRLAVKLSNGQWTPIPKKSDRTTVQFLSKEGELELYLTEAPGFISLTPVLVEELEEEPLAELHKLCRQLHDTLHKSIVASAEDVLGEEFSQTAKIVFGFECGCGRVPHLATPASAEGKSMICQATHMRSKSLKKERIWFSPVHGTELVEVDGCNMWVMEETGGPSSHPLQTGHLQQKVHAQQYPACSEDTAKEQDAVSLRIADVPCFEKLLRKHVAQNVGKQGHSLLIFLGLSDAEIQMLHNNNPHNYTNAIHGGLLRFKDRAGTWGELIEAMQEAGIGLQYIEALKGELNSVH